MRFTPFYCLLALFVPFCLLFSVFPRFSVQIALFLCYLCLLAPIYVVSYFRYMYPLRTIVDRCHISVFLCFSSFFLCFCFSPIILKMYLFKFLFDFYVSLYRKSLFWLELSTLSLVSIGGDDIKCSFISFLSSFPFIFP